MKTINYTILAIFLLLGAVVQAQSLEQTLGTHIDAVVDLSGNGDYSSIQKAVDSAPDNGSEEYVIFIKNGIYYEKIEIPSSKTHLTIIGEHMDKTVIHYDDHNGSGKIYQGILTGYNGSEIGTFTSHVILAQPDYFTLANLTVRNSAGPVGQAVALNLGGDQNVVYRCRVQGHQDTFFSGNDGRMLFKEVYVEGNVDFIFGGGVVWFQDCLIVSNRNNSQITAASTGENLAYGYIFNECQVFGLDNITGIGLGRPWKDYCKTVFMNSYMGDQMADYGWAEWYVSPEKTYYAIYNCNGPGSDFKTYADWAHQLTDDEAKAYKMENVFKSSVKSPAYAQDWVPDVATDVFKAVEQYSVDPVADSLYYLPKLDQLIYDGKELTDYDPTLSVFQLPVKGGVFDTTLLEVVTVDPMATVQVVPPKQIPGYAFIEIKARNNSSKGKFLIQLSEAVLSTDVPRDDLLIFPNPSDQWTNLKVNFPENLTFPLRMEIFDTSGKKVKVRRFDSQEQTLTINGDDLQRGIYQCRIISADEKIYSQKLMIK